MKTNKIGDLRPQLHVVFTSPKTSLKFVLFDPYFKGTYEQALDLVDDFACKLETGFVVEHFNFDIVENGTEKISKENPE